MSYCWRRCRICIESFTCSATQRTNESYILCVVVVGDSLRGGADQAEGMALKYFGIVPSECIMRCVYVFGVNKEKVT